jgi:hypothetical protein
MVHGRFSGGGRPTKIAVDILRIEGGRLAEHWDVIQDEATRAESKSGLPMFGNRFPDARHRTARETNMTTHAFDGERVTLTTTRKFSDVVAHIDRALGHPNIAELFCKIQAAQTPDEVNEVVAAAAGPLQLMEFMRLDFGLMLRKDKQPVDRNALRFIIGNPVIMREMVRGTPDAGSYAPVTVLLDERAGGVQLSYDRVASLLAAYGDPHALQVARDLDAKVEGLLYEAAGQAPDKP